jgi:hypothetical protein
VRDGQRTRDHENSARHATAKTTSTPILHALCAGSDDAWWRCSVHDNDKVRIARNNEETYKLLRNVIKAPSFTTKFTTKQKHKITNKNNHGKPTPCFIKQTYNSDPVHSNEEDGPKMTTTQCNRRRR